MPLTPEDQQRLTDRIVEAVAAQLAPAIPLLAADIDRQAASGDGTAKSRTLTLALSFDLTRWENAAGYDFAEGLVTWTRKHPTKIEIEAFSLDLKQPDLPLDGDPMEDPAPPGRSTIRIIRHDGSASPKLDLARATPPAPSPRRRKSRTA